MALPLIAAGAAIRVPLMVGGAAAYRAATVKMSELGQDSMDVLAANPIPGLPHNEGQLAGVDDGYDAFRHAYASAKLTQELRDSFTGEMSPDVAKSTAYATTLALGAAHEAKGWLQGKWGQEAHTEASMGMDLWNNRVGATLGKELPYQATPEQTRDAVAAAFQRGDLITTLKDPRALQEYNSHTLEQKLDDLKKAFIGEKVSALTPPREHPQVQQLVQDYQERNIALGNTLESRTSLAAFAAERLSPEPMQEGARAIAQPSGFHRLTDEVPPHDQTVERQQLVGWMQALEDRGLVLPEVTDRLAVRVENGTPASWDAALNEELKAIANQGSLAIRQDAPVAETSALAEGSMQLLSIDAGRAREFAEQQPGWTPDQVISYAFLQEVAYLREAPEPAEAAAENPEYPSAAQSEREQEADAFTVAAVQAVEGPAAAQALAGKVGALRESETGEPDLPKAGVLAETQDPGTRESLPQDTRSADTQASAEMALV